MSEMQFDIGTFKKSKLDVKPEDTDEHYELEKQLGCIFVVVNDEVYEVHPIPEVEDLDSYGFQFTIETEHLQDPIIMGYWYNGGAGWHEVAQSAIENYLKG